MLPLSYYSTKSTRKEARGARMDDPNHQVELFYRTDESHPPVPEKRLNLLRPYMRRGRL